MPKIDASVKLANVQARGCRVNKKYNATGHAGIISSENVVYVLKIEKI
jgi:hypothetical protein